jgi:hypothetical protein
MGLFYAMVNRKSARQEGSNRPRQSQPSRLGFPGWSRLRRRGHDDPGRTQNALVETEAGFEDLDDRARSHVGPRLLEHGFMQRRVEGLAPRIDPGDAEAAKDLQQLRLHQSAQVRYWKAPVLDEVDSMAALKRF